jgi:hypothetical protein
MDWFEIIHEPFFDLIEAVFILAAYAFGTYLSTLRRKNGSSMLLGLL